MPNYYTDTHTHTTQSKSNRINIVKTERFYSQSRQRKHVSSIVLRTNFKVFCFLFFLLIFVSCTNLSPPSSSPANPVETLASFPLLQPIKRKKKEQKNVQANVNRICSQKRGQATLSSKHQKVSFGVSAFLLVNLFSCVWVVCSMDFKLEHFTKGQTKKTFNRIIEDDVILIT